jgi:transposase-like protein
VTPQKKPASSPELDAAKELARLAREQGLALPGPDGLLKALTKTVLETALNEELNEHLGYDKHDPAGRDGGNIRNGARPKTVLTDTTGAVLLDVPRDRAGTFEPQIVRKRQRRLNGVDEMVLSLYAKEVDHRRDFGPIRRDLRSVGVEGDDQPDHRQGWRPTRGLR